MTDRLTQAVREQLGFGRLLPLGGAQDRAWVMEHAVAGVLRAEAAAVDTVLIRTLRIEPSGPSREDVPEPLPPSALPPGPLLITADVEAVPDDPLPASAQRLRGVLARTAVDRIGLDLTGVDLRVTGLLDQPVGQPVEEPADQPVGEHGDDEGPPPADPLAVAAAAVPGVVRLSPWVGSGEGVQIVEATEPPVRHVQVQITADHRHRTLDVARAVRAAVTAAATAQAPGPVTAAVVVTAIA
ncbi:nucleopolyhedrovirus P10 family protein [Streptomyces sp. RB6PN25]|uniref:Nucleopolyhedrovirus P10 family protein n=1 Tax=Streptomyces humicola TaxID=2953240 RepID=A0ABT1Q1Z2_9ACTN|nr:nucleopolyhedrovirus P10 family protein [Streptomyces humicola]MCQ4083393.1 nucleopolyhedrovirus P10 family protein [Streptomyces humicola]